MPKSVMAQKECFKLKTIPAMCLHALPVLLSSAIRHYEKGAWAYEVMT